MKAVAVFVAFVAVSLSALTSVQADDRPIRPGNTGPAVVAVQEQLRSWGYTVSVDGQFGPQTERAVRHWQKANGLVVDGIVGPETLASIHAPATGAQPATRVGNAFPTPSPASPEQIIRDLWPDSVEDHAVAIATRESRLVPTARNACCWGLFQIHWNAHRAWLQSIGVTSPTQLLDPTTNAYVALALFNAAGWGPWAL